MMSTDFLSVTEVAKLWGVSPRSVRNYCAQGRIPGALLVGKTWNIPSDAFKPRRLNERGLPESALLVRLREEKDWKMKGGIYHKTPAEQPVCPNRLEERSSFC